MTSEVHIYASPDIRKQTIADAENFITQKRARRLVLVQSHNEKTKSKLATLKGKELDLFTSRLVRVKNAEQKVIDAINLLERAINNLSTSNTNLVNIENQENLL